MSAAGILVAGVGNVFLGDDGFGVEVVRRLSARPLPEGVEVADYGIRGYDLAYALLEGHEAVILVDALPRGEPPGTLCVLEPELEGLEAAGVLDGHGMNPMEVFRLVRQLGGTLPPTYVVGCEPASFGPADQGSMELSQPVAAAVDDAVELVESLLGRVARDRQGGRDGPRPHEMEAR
jgi:hydrogenase maturation protease